METENEEGRMHYLKMRILKKQIIIKKSSLNFLVNKNTAGKTILGRDLHLSLFVDFRAETT